MVDDPGQIDAKPEAPTYPADEYLLIKDDLATLDFVFGAVENLDGPLRDIGDAFSANLVAVYITASALWVFARNTARRAAYLMLYGVAMGVDRAVKPGDDPERGQKVRESVSKDLTSSEWSGRFDEIAGGIADENLKRFLAEPMSREATAHVLRQCAVLTWSAIEVLTSDLFVLLVNSSPKLSALLFRDERTKKLYQAKDFVVALDEYDYDLSGRMGDVLLRQCRMDNLATIRATYDVLFSEDEVVRGALCDPQLWRLYKTRNLIVHRAAIVDEMFVQSTGADVKVGTSLKITSQQLEDFMVLVGKAGIGLLNAASRIQASTSKK